MEQPGPESMDKGSFGHSRDADGDRLGNPALGSATCLVSGKISALLRHAWFSIDRWLSVSHDAYSESVPVIPSQKSNSFEDFKEYREEDLAQL